MDMYHSESAVINFATGTQKSIPEMTRHREHPVSDHRQRHSAGIPGNSRILWLFEHITVQDRVWILPRQSMTDHIESRNDPFQLILQIDYRQCLEALVHKQLSSRTHFVLGGDLDYAGGHHLTDSLVLIVIGLPAMAPEVIGSDHPNELSVFDHRKLLILPVQHHYGYLSHELIRVGDRRVLSGHDFAYFFIQHSLEDFWVKRKTVYKYTNLAVKT